MHKTIATVCLAIMITAFSCEKDFKPDPDWRYFEVAIRNYNNENWRDSSFIVATKDPALLQKIEAQLALPEANRMKIVAGKLSSGNGNYNKNGDHSFKWRIKEDDWDLVDLTIELSDGRPYSDVDLNFDYWMEKVKRYTPWGSYVRREVVR